MPFNFYTSKGKAEEFTLIDSGATGNFIDYWTVLKYRLKLERLQFPLPIRNVDGTNNRSGLINRSLDLVIRKGKEVKRNTFYVTNLGEDRIILGYPW